MSGMRESPVAEERARPALGPLLRHVRAALQDSGRPDAALEARLLVEHFTATTRSDAVLDPERPVSRKDVEALEAALARRLAGEPVHRILGHRDFYGLRLMLSAGTLEPRPDTETLVDLALPVVRGAARRNGRCRILDLGTGTGAVALALLCEEPRAEALGVDVDADALETARRNADLNGLAHRFDAIRSDWFAAVEGEFDLIVSNPPYIATAEMAGLDPEVRNHDPVIALDGGTDGLCAYRVIARGARAHMAPGAMVAVEIGIGQRDDVERCFAQAGFVAAAAARDLAGIERALLFAS
jgi:release factor glutamine methyltransferase